VDGFTRKAEFIVTEWPKQSTIDSFWTLIYDHSCHTVVNLSNQGNPRQYPTFIHNKGKANYGPFIVEVLNYHQYPAMTSHMVKVMKREQSSGRGMSGKVPFKVPFISDKHFLRKCGITYLITCQSCVEEYIGETTRPLHVRVKEHLDGKAKSRTFTATGHHRIHEHTGYDFEVRAKLLAVEAQTASRKALEAFWIHAKDHKLNRKGDVTQEPGLTSVVMQMGSLCPSPRGKKRHSKPPPPPAAVEERNGVPPGESFRLKPEYRGRVHPIDDLCGYRASTPSPSQDSHMGRRLLPPRRRLSQSADAIHERDRDPYREKGAADIKRLLNIRREKADLQKETTKQIQKLVCR
ncbi:unnamed protein product, partial [Heligmosomoides polygyrus]|uniref:Tyrosine-protein phosphatase domain-containing protein n=1 Tax=Heligmosomoides polygyrus TaxID=6339 RepID=A0A183F738_HELPZ